MNFTANDGSKHGSQMQAYQASQTPAAPTDAPKDIESDPHAMQLVDELKQMGYTADDVAKAMGDDQDASPGGQEATKAAPMQIPGM